MKKMLSKSPIDKEDMLYRVVYLFSIMCDRLQDGTQGLEADGNIQQMGGKEEIVEVAHHGEGKVPEGIEERVVCDGNPRLPHLVPPVDVQNAGNTTHNNM